MTAGVEGMSAAAGRAAVVPGAGPVVVLPRPVWPGLPEVTVTAIVVAVSGVWLVDSRDWRGVRMTSEGLTAGRSQLNDQVARLAWLTGQLAGDLVRFGLSATEVHGVLTVPGSRAFGRAGAVVVIGRDALPELVAEPGRRLSDRAFTQVSARVAAVFPDARPEPEQAARPSRRALPTPASAADRTPGRAARAVVSQRDAGRRPTSGPDDGTWAEIADRLAAAPPVPAWACFLDPVQAAAAWRRQDGPQRVRGAFGTGRSTVAVHRAVHLARVGIGEVALVVPHAAQLAPTQARVRQVTDPETAHRIVVTTPDGLAVHLLRAAGQHVPTDDGQVAQAWANALAQAGFATQDRCEAELLHDEVSCVIRARGLLSPGEHERLRPLLPSATRRLAWEVAQGYSRELARHGVPDARERVRAARMAVHALTRTGELTRLGMTGVVVDDANDLTYDELALVHELVGEDPGMLTVCDDGLPGLHPAGPWLGEVGVDADARTVDLRHSYRLAAEPWRFVVDQLRDDGGRDLAGRPVRPQLAAPLLEGGRPLVCRSAVARLRREQTVARVAELLDGGCPPDRVAVLCLGPTMDAELVELLDGVCPTQPLDGTDPAALRVGPAAAARAIEADHVLVPDLPHRSPEDHASVFGSWEQVVRVRRLALAVSRARRTSWIGTV